MAFIIFGDYFTFPEGNASTNRVYTYAKGFIEHGIITHVICFNNDYMDKYNGETDGIKYYHPFSQTNRSSYFIVRTWQKLRKYFNAYRLIRELNKKDRIIAIDVYTEVIITQLFAFTLAKSLKTKLLIERCEHPLRNYNGNPAKLFIGNFRVWLETRLYDGIFCISEYLINFYRSKGFDQRKLFLVPSTVDTGRFDNQLSSPLPYRYILYCGSLTLLKDGVHILIESFAKISDRYPEIKLVLIGAADTLRDEMMLKKSVIRLNLDDRVVFLGKMARTDIPVYLNNAEVLVMARPLSIIADAGFPSKLTEYLSTGNPIIATKVGEIPVYLEDNVNAFLSEPDNADAFAEKMEYVLNNYEVAQRVGERGKELTRTIFNYNYQTKRMIAFIKTLY